MTLKIFGGPAPWAPVARRLSKTMLRIPYKFISFHELHKLISHYYLKNLTDLTCKT